MIEQKKDEPLVSIIIITYNSSQYVLETLESAKAQSYKNIELIISDDSSSDNTVLICKKWIAKNKERFLKTEIISSEANTGTTANCNRGLAQAEGEWIKFIAGDDILLKNCINDFIDYCRKNEECKILFGKMYILRDEKLEEEKEKTFYSLSQKKQFLKILSGSGIPSQACFLNSSLLKELGGYNETYKFIEDAPLWIKASERGIHFYFINKFVVTYRLHEHNISRLNKGSKFIKENFYQDSKKILLNEVVPRLKSHKRIIDIFNIYNTLLIYEIIFQTGNRNNLLSRILELFIIRNLFNKLINKFNGIIQKA